MRRSRWLLWGAFGVLTLGGAGCGDDPDPETHESWDVGDCVTVGQGDIDEADCDDDEAARIEEIIGPFNMTGAGCPEGTRSVTEYQRGPGIQQELRVCLEE